MPSGRSSTRSGKIGSSDGRGWRPNVKPLTGRETRYRPARGTASGTRGQGGKPPRGAAVPRHGHRGGGRRAAGGRTAEPASGGRTSRTDGVSPASYADRDPDGS